MGSVSDKFVRAVKDNEAGIAHPSNLVASPSIEPSPPEDAAAAGPLDIASHDFDLRDQLMKPPNPLHLPALLPALLLAALLPSQPASAQLVQVRPGEILPAGVSYDPAVPTPASVLGFEVGERHVRHDQLVSYMERLAAGSDRVRLERQGLTYEKRPLLLLTISSPENLERLETIRRRHLERSEGSEDTPEADDTAGDAPVVVWLGYSIHGNEASGANASLLVAYHLAAAQGPEIEALLEHTVILLDPSLNPDGLGRFAQWANMYRGEQPVGDPASREHDEAWPGGRTNHYWFDLNRDWLLLQHPESRARVATLQRWRPNVVADFHEMGGDATFFFQPGVPSRRNPLTPQRNVELTQEIARYHAKALDREGRLYFTEETFDDFYYGKGSTYPDAQGAIGILFEQASVRGHARETENGRMGFAFAVSNQFLTSLSTLRAAADKRGELLEYQASFFRQARAEARRDPLGAYVFDAAEDPMRAYEMARILAAHDIELHTLSRPLELEGHRFEPGAAWVVPLEQRQSRLVRTLFETVTEFEDSTFYDVSTWTLPLAFGLPYAAVPRERLSEALGEHAESLEAPRGALGPAENAYAYAFEWSPYLAPRALERLLAAGVVVRVASRPFEVETDHGPHELGLGTIVVPTGLQTVSPERLRELLAAAAREDAVDIHTLTTGLTPRGVDLGSPNLRPVRLPKPLLVIGEGVSAYEAGEMWHLLDYRFGLEVSLVPMASLEDLDLARYTHVLMVDGDYQGLPEAVVSALRRWIRGGGTLIATRRAALWAGDALLEASGAATPAPSGGGSEAGEAERPIRRPYAQYSEDRAAELISGAILEVELDLTNPLAFGYRRSRLPVFRNWSRALAPSLNPYENVALYTEEPVLSGYVSEANAARLRGTAALVAHKEGEGAILRFADDPSFRGFWHGTQKLLLNALYFGPTLRWTSAPRSWR
jgi:hypothetical protein